MSTAKVFVGSLPQGCKPEELRHLFANYGNVVECDIMNRCGFVHLQTVEMAEAAIAALNGVDFKGQSIVVEPGRPKDRRSGGGGGGGGERGAGNRRPMQGHGGSNFNRAGNNFRGGGSGGGGNRSSGNSNDSHFGPVRSEGNFRQQRSAPYSKGVAQRNQNFDGPSHGYKNKFNHGSGNMSHNDYHSHSHSHSHSSGGGSGGSGSQRGAGGSSSSNNIGQDRRGFALPVVDHQPQQQQVSFGAKQGRFGNGPMQNGSSADNGMFQRNRSNSSISSGSPQGGRGSFNANRGGFAGRGGFHSRRGGSGGASGSNSNISHSQSFNKHGPANGHNHNAANAYQSDFPPLGSHGGGAPGNRNRFNGPRPAGGNRRF